MLIDFHSFCTTGKRIKFSIKLVYYFPPYLRCKIQLISDSQTEVGKNCQFHLTFRFFPFLLQQKSLITASNVIWFTVLLLYVLMFVFYYVYEIFSVYYLSHCYDIRKQHKSVSQATRPIRWCRSPFPLLSARHQFTLRDHGYRVSAWCGMPVYICPSFHWYPLCLPAEGRSG